MNAAPILVENALALKNRATHGFLIAAVLDRPLTAQFWRGQINGLSAILQWGSELSHMAALDAASGGYQPSGLLKRAFAALPDGFERLPLTEVQELLRAQGAQITPDSIPDRNVDAVVKGKDCEGVCVVQPHDEHCTSRIDVGDGAAVHGEASLVQERIVAPVAPGQYWTEQSAWYAGPVVQPDGRVFALLLPDKAMTRPRESWAFRVESVAANSLHDGRANTKAMLAARSPIARELEKIHPDLYLPSRIEAQQIFAILQERVGRGAFWTSTQASAACAWCQHSGDGYQHTYSKVRQFRVVAVRSVLLHSFASAGGEQ